MFYKWYNGQFNQCLDSRHATDTRLEARDFVQDNVENENIYNSSIILVYGFS